MRQDRHRSDWTLSLVVLVVAASVVLSVSMGLRQSLGLFLGPMARSAEVTAAGFGIAMAVQNLAWGLTQPLTGMLADRFGGRVVVLAAGPVYALGLVLMALAGGIGLQLGGGLLVGLAVAGSAFGVVIGAVSRQAPDDRKAMAVAIVAAAGSIGTLVLAPLGQHLIETRGWVDALLAFAAIAGLVSLGGIALEDRPVAATAGPRPQPLRAMRAAFAHKGFVATTIAFFACGFQLIFIATHLPSYLELCGMPPSVGAGALALIGVFNAVGTLIVGGLGARYGNGVMLALVYVARTAAIAVYVTIPAGVETTLLFAAVMGFLWLSVVPLASGLISSMFGTVNFGTLFGVMFLSHQVGSFLGAWLGGLSFDVFGDYTVAWWSLVAIGVAAALLQFAARTTPAAAPA